MVTKITSVWNNAGRSKQQINIRLDAIDEQQIKRYWKKEFGLRGRSEWIKHAVLSFLDCASYQLGDFQDSKNESALIFVELIRTSQSPKKLGPTISLSLNGDVVEKLDRCESKVEPFFVTTKGLRSSIIRAAIRWHLEDRKSKGAVTRRNDFTLKMAGL